MPKSQSYDNGFSKRELHEITGLSLPMIDYLARHGYLKPTYRPGVKARGRAVQGMVRYYSYRDLVIARTIQRLRESGVRLSKLKSAVLFLKKNAAWREEATGEDAPDAVKWLVFERGTIHLRREDGFLDEMKEGGQRSFSFIVGLEGMRGEVRQLIPVEKQAAFTMRNLPLVRTKAGSG